MATQIAPSVGAGILFSQGGVGAAPGYAAIDDRRADGSFITQGIINTGAYNVTQRGAGANMSVDIAANAGTACVLGTTIANQGIYTVPPHSAVINEAIAAADPTNPRIDQIILRCYDNAIDSTGQNKAQVEVLTGTPSAGATLVNRTGALALSANAIRLADVLVPAASASVTNANIKDRRPKTRGKSIVATPESRTNVAYGTLTTPDQVNEIVVPTDGLIAIAYQATWQDSVASAGLAAIFIGSNQLKVLSPPASSLIAAEAAMGAATVNSDMPLASFACGLISSNSTGYTGDVTTGQLVGASGSFGGPCLVFVAAGTYDVSVQFKSSSGSVTAKNRKLWVWTMDANMGVVA